MLSLLNLRHWQQRAKSSLGVACQCIAPTLNFMINCDNHCRCQTCHDYIGWLHDIAGWHSRACPELERSVFHKVLPMLSILSVFPLLSSQDRDIGRMEIKVMRLEICSQVWRGHLEGRLQSLGIRHIDSLSALATCLKNRSSLVWMSWDSSGDEPARSRTVAYVSHFVFLPCILWLKDTSYTEKCLRGPIGTCLLGTRWCYNNNNNNNNTK